PAHRLELEITETVLMSNTFATLTTLHHLRKLGVRIALDDFGTGYSALSYLRCFPFDKIKIDRSFISNLVEEDNSRAIVQAVVNLARDLNMTTTAEGIETEEQMCTVRDLGCREMQGYFFSRPQPAADIARMLAPPAVPAAGPAQPPAEAPAASPGSAEAGFQLRRPQGTVVRVLERHRHDLGGAVDRHLAEELQALAGGQVLALLLGWGLDVHQLRPERVVELVRPKRAGVQRAGHELPERLEILKHRLAGVVIMRGRVVHVGREPHGVADAGALDEGQDVGDLELAAARRTVALGHRLDAPFAVAVIDDDQAERHVGGDHLPGRLRVHQLALEPGDLLRP